MAGSASRRLVSRARRARPAIAALLVAILSSTIVPGALAARPTITREIRHDFSSVQHFDASPECGFPGATEYASGNDHLIVVDGGDDVHVTFGETFRILVVYDDPTWANEERQGTDAIHFNLTKGGTVTFSESFHDFASRDGSPNFWKIRYYRTFTEVEGEIRVDREVLVNAPPC